ncbi:MAG: FMN-binding glutamate synthase family protein, partial [Candidatus Bathyarchaeota archaeon]
VDAVFVEAGKLRNRLRDRFDRIPTGAIGLYTYNQRLVQGLRQLMCGARKFSLEKMTRDDIAALTAQAARISGIQYIMDADKEEVDKILG